MEFKPSMMPKHADPVQEKPERKEQKPKFGKNRQQRRTQKQPYERPDHLYQLPFQENPKLRELQKQLNASDRRRRPNFKQK